MESSLSINSGLTLNLNELYYFRDEQGLEIDFILPGRSGSWILLECKAGKTVFPEMARPMLRLAESWRKHGRRGTNITHGSGPPAVRVGPGDDRLGSRGPGDVMAGVAGRTGGLTGNLGRAAGNVRRDRYAKMKKTMIL